MFSFAESRVIGVLSAGALSLSASMAWSGSWDSDIYIQQVVATDSHSTDSRSRQALPEHYAGPAMRLAQTAMMLGNSLPMGATVVQHGKGNIASSALTGMANTSGQFQLGSWHNSHINVDGHNNRVVNLQKGTSSYSDISITGSNKTIYHVQLGATPRLKELPFSNNTPASYLVIDNGSQAYIRKLD